MKRALLIAVVVAVAAALPATAGAGQWRGVVVAKETNRGTIVTASRSGVVRTVRVESGLGKIRVGQRVAVKAQRLGDGTFRLQKIRVVGKAVKARVRAIVVRHQTRLGRIVVSAGGSVFALRAKIARRLAHDDDDGFEAGDRIDAHLAFDDDEFEVDDADEIGHAGLLELEGIYVGPDSGMLKLTVHGVALSVIVPAGFTLPPLAAGDELELLVSVGTGDGSFTLVGLENETADDDEGDEDEDEDEDHGVDLDDDDDEVEVKGTFGVPATGVVSVQPASGSAVQCHLNGGVVPAGITVGDVVEMECSLVGGKFVVQELEEEDESEADDDDENEDHSGPGDSDDDDHEEEHSGESDD